GHSALNRNPINDWWLLWSHFGRKFPISESLFGARPTLSPVHQYPVDGETVEPSGEGRLAAKAADFLPQAQKDILPQILGFGGVGRQAQTQSVDSVKVPAVQNRKGFSFTSGGPARQDIIAREFIIERLRAFGFNYAHLHASTFLGRLPDDRQRFEMIGW